MNWIKWIFLTAITVALATVVISFNLNTFELVDALPYVITVLVITGYAIAIKSLLRKKTPKVLRIAAFVSVIFLWIALAANAILSISIQREMGVAKQQSGQQTANLQALKDLDRRAQRNATKHMDLSDKLTDSFKGQEGKLRMIMFIEIAFMIISASVLVGIHSFRDDEEALQSFKASQASQALPQASQASQASASLRPQPSQAYLEASQASQASKANRKPETYYNQDGSKAYRLLFQPSGAQVRDFASKAYLGHIGRKALEAYETNDVLTYEWITDNMRKQSL